MITFTCRCCLSDLLLFSNRCTHCWWFRTKKKAGEFKIQLLNVICLSVLVSDNFLMLDGISHIFSKMSEILMQIESVRIQIIKLINKNIIWCNVVMITAQERNPGSWCYSWFRALYPILTSACVENICLSLGPQGHGPQWSAKGATPPPPHSHRPWPRYQY